MLLTEVYKDCARYCVRAAEWCFVIAMRIVPQRSRFFIAERIARASVRLLSRTAAFREQEIKNFHNPYEISLHLVLNALTKNGTTFDPIITVKGFEEFVRAHCAGNGVLVIGHHAALTLLMVRFLDDKALDPIVVTPDRLMRVGGRKRIGRTIQPSPTFLLKIRSSLRRGDVICAMPDRAEHHAERTVDCAIPGGRLIVDPALMEVAARCNAEVVFAEVHAEQGQLVGTIVAPSASAASTVTDDFISFVQSSARANASLDA